MGEAGGNPDLFFILGGEADGGPFFKGGGGAADINGDVEDFAMCDADELALRIFHLIVQAAEHAFGGARVIILHEMRAGTGGAAASNSRSLKDSKKKPRESPKTFGSRMNTSGMSVRVTVIGWQWLLMGWRRRVSSWRRGRWMPGASSS